MLYAYEAERIYGAIKELEGFVSVYVHSSSKRYLVFDRMLAESDVNRYKLELFCIGKDTKQIAEEVKFIHRIPKKIYVRNGIPVAEGTHAVIAEQFGKHVTEVARWSNATRSYSSVVQAVKELEHAVIYDWQVSYLEGCE